MSPAERAAEKRGYAKGYATGMRRLERETSKEEFRRAVFLTALPDLLKGTWTRGTAKVNTPETMTDVAWNIADAALRRAHF